jgi:hypothetical protein
MLRNRLLVCSVLLLGLLLLPQGAQAQMNSFNFCTVFEQIPQTEGVRSALFEEWDENSSTWASTERWILTYQDGNPTEYLFQERDRSGVWADTARAQATYDSADRITRCTFQLRQEGMYVNAFRNNLSYANGRLDEEIVQVWDTTDTNPNGTWVNSFRSTYSYDSNGNVTRRVDDLWDREAGQWSPFARERNTYDASNRLTERLEEQADGSGGWINNRRTRKTYGSNGITETVEEDWNLTSQAWENDVRTQFTYPATDRRIEVDQEWNGSSWTNVERRTIDQNEDELPVAEVVEEWDGSAWVRVGRTQNSFTTVDGTRKFRRALDQTWAATTSSWVNDTRTTLSYTGVIPVELASFTGRSDAERAVLRWKTASETNNAGFEVQHRTSSDGPWTVRGYIESNATGGTTSEPQSYRFRTDELELGTHHFRLRQIDLDGHSTTTDPISVTLRLEEAVRLTAPAPHPVTDRATFSFALNEQNEAEVILYNLLGQRVRTLHRGPVSPHSEQVIELDARSLSSGTYVLRLEAGDRVQTRSVTVVR